MLGTQSARLFQHLDKIVQFFVSQNLSEYEEVEFAIVLKVTEANRRLLQIFKRSNPTLAEADEAVALASRVIDFLLNMTADDMLSPYQLSLALDFPTQHKSRLVEGKTPMARGCDQVIHFPMYIDLLHTPDQITESLVAGLKRQERRASNHHRHSRIARLFVTNYCETRWAFLSVLFEASISSCGGLSERRCACVWSTHTERLVANNT